MTSSLQIVAQTYTHDLTTPSARSKLTYPDGKEI